MAVCTTTGVFRASLGASDHVSHHASAGFLPVNLLVRSLLNTDDSGCLRYGELRLPVQSATRTVLKLLSEFLLALPRFVQS